MNNRVDLLLVNPGLVDQFVGDDRDLFYILRARWPSAMISFADPPARRSTKRNKTANRQPLGTKTSTVYTELGNTMN